MHAEPLLCHAFRVEYFGVMLESFAFTKAGWVQSYGSRMCARPSSTAISYDVPLRDSLPAPSP